MDTQIRGGKIIDTLKIYLAGACKNEIDDGKEWRSQITEKLKIVAEWNGKKIKIIDPTKYFSYSEHKHKSQKQVKDFYLNKISKCDLVIINLNNSDASIGTAQEVQFAVDMHIPVVGFGVQNVYPWLSEVDCQVVFDTMTELVDYIRDFYMDE